MTEPVLLRHSFAIASLTALQFLLPPVLTVGTLFVAGILIDRFDPASTAVAIIAALSITQIQRPPDLSMQFTPSIASPIMGVVVRWFVLLFMFLSVGYVTKSLDGLPRSVFAVWATVTPLLLVIATVSIHYGMRRLLVSATPARKTVICGYNDSSRALARQLQGSLEGRLELQGYFDDRGSERLGPISDGRLIGKLDELVAYVKRENIDVIFIALPIRHLKRVMDLVDRLQDSTASIYYVPDVFVFDLIQARSTEIHGIPVIAMCETPLSGYRGVIKRLIDVTVSSVALLLLSPVMIGVALLVRLTSPGPIVFKQRRYGLDGHEFEVYKFRTMTVTEDGSVVTQASRNDRRFTPVGAFLRRTSLDELPQLINVLQGRMSLVGPRPHAVAHNEQYRSLIKGYMFRHKVLPGITGLAQVNGCRGETARLEDMEARVRYDLDYLRHWSPMLDFKIMWRTAVRLLRDEKAY
jgi:putative colanic acid biosynthesis UDP-glucose lipid carrier transferase